MWKLFTYAISALAQARFVKFTRIKLESYIKTY